MSDFTITDRHIAFNERATGALEGLLSNLSAQRVSRLMSAVQKISVACASIHAISPSSDEVAALHSVKLYTLADDDYPLDVEGAISEIVESSAKVGHWIASKPQREMTPHQIEMSKLPNSKARLDYARKFGIENGEESDS
ncbi:hypothetical protein ACFFUT_17115 [Pseudohalocynthiibacter aestuariivivens]|uniref:Uncharacterized protein n=1 Tax=Pseudohalocynthiibacter aestuariivivens TaxID=1591409 RepID=A0ABV5JM15_9RHOB|nr:hypothetical protein [Pseudohalocynthiibacter aestuariivivens]MBS9716745.1 hypothetical protein [Pseudohalocynthiibacter aestuariivivens]